MTLRGWLDRVLFQEDVNFLITNRIPRRALTRLVARLSTIEQPLVRDVSIAVFQWFAGDLRLHEARTTRFKSLHDCFTRELREGARSIDPRPGVLVSPCDALVGAVGRIRDGELLQAKGMRYTLAELLDDPQLAARFRDGSYVTLRLTASMYHRFHAPATATISGVRYLSGDVWNVNPPALARVPRLFCRNERAVLPLALHESVESLALVPVGAILVASIQLAFLDVGSTPIIDGRRTIDRQYVCEKGEQLGHFRHGSTIVVVGTSGLAPCPDVVSGRRIFMGQPLLAHHGSPTAPRGTR